MITHLQSNKSTRTVTILFPPWWLWLLFPSRRWSLCPFTSATQLCSFSLPTQLDFPFYSTYSKLYTSGYDPETGKSEQVERKSQNEYSTTTKKKFKYYKEIRNCLVRRKILWVLYILFRG